MPIHLVALAPKLASITQFVGSQLKDPAKRAIGVDPMSKALQKGVESFLAAFEAEYEQRETFSTLLEGPTKESVSAFVHEPSTLALLTEAFTDPESLNGRRMSALWGEVRLPGGSPLISLPTAFDWDAVLSSYLESVRGIKSHVPELREPWSADNLERTREATEALRGVAPRFSVTKYRDALMQEYGTLKLSAIHADYNPASADKTVALQGIYVKQQVKEAFPPRDLSRDYRRRLEAEARVFGVSERTEREALLTEYERVPARPLHEALADDSYQRVVILGDPGLGKSTLLQHLSLDWAEGASQLIPFLVELRKYTRDHSHPRSFLEFLESGTWSCCHLAQGELDRYLREHQATVLFDGLDEVFDPSLRGNIVAEIISFVRDYPAARVIVTTRVVGYAVGSPNPELFRAAGFRQLTLQDFNDEEIGEFISKWYAAAISDATERDQLAGRLTKDIAGSSSIRELAGNPLLLTMMALLNRRKHLPRERLKLYEACAELLVEGWDAARHLERSVYLTHDDKIEILQRIAYEMQHERHGLGGNMISEKRLRLILVSALGDRDIENPRMVADKIVSALAERDFMLCSVGDEQFSFVHRTFLEYFCAKEFRSHLENGGSASELTKVFRDRWSDDAWHEVLRLVCAMVGPDLARGLIGELLSAGAERANWAAVFLAAECAAEVRQVAKVEAERKEAYRLLNRLLTFRGDSTDAAILVRTGSLQRLGRLWPGEEATKTALMNAASNQFWKVRFTAVEELIKQWPADPTRRWLEQSAAGPDWALRMAAVHGLATGWPDEDTRQFLVAQLQSNDPHVSFHTAVEELSRHWPAETTREWLTQLATLHHAPDARSVALREVVRRWTDDNTKAWLLDQLSKTTDTGNARNAAVELLQHWPGGPTTETVLALAEQKDRAAARDGALMALAVLRQSPQIRRLVSDRLQEPGDAVTRVRLIEAVAYGAGAIPEAKKILVQLATTDRQGSARSAALALLTQNWTDEETRLLARRAAERDGNAQTRKVALRELVEHWPTTDTKQLLVEIATTKEREEDVTVREAARDELADRWPDDVEVLRVLGAEHPAGQEGTPPTTPPKSIVS
jgi:hypothetical protein